MDSSLSKALIMVASVLLAMLVIAFFTYTMGRMSQWSSAKDEELLIEQKEKFNKEYEVYDKSLMYGVDVISCLNKAKSNNDKIIGVSYTEAMSEDYEIEVSVEIKNALTEGVRVYYMGNTGKELEYASGTGPAQSKSKRGEDVFTISQEYKDSNISNLSVIKNNGYLKQGYEDSDVENGVYKLTEDDILTKLLTLSNELKQIRKNNASNSADGDSWTKAIWETPLYDLKTRKFKCTNLTYSEKTGRVNYIEFKEI